MVLFWLLAVVAVMVFGCGKGEEIPTSTTTTLPSTPAPGVSNLFNLTGVVAVMSAQKTGAEGHSVKTMQGTEGDILKYTASGEITSLFATTYYHPQVTVIEKSPIDGSLYVGLASGIMIGEPSTLEPKGGGQQYAFFRIKPDGSVEVVDANISGMGTWYTSSYWSELPAKQVQFDSAGNVYYLGMTSGGQKVLKKKSTDGTITQIGSSAYNVYDFLAAPNGFVLFHGADSSSYSTEWLKIFSGSSVYTIFYNTDLSMGSLRSYFLDKNNNIILVGSNLRMFEDPSLPDSSPIRRYAGVIRVGLNPSGAPIATEVLLDDNNMYGTAGTTLGQQLIYGYWDPATGSFVKFFTEEAGAVKLPLAKRTGVSEEAIRAYIRTKFKTITSDNLGALTFEGITTSESYTIGYYLDYLISQYISGETWEEWRTANGLEGVPFSSAKQVLPAEDGSVYLVMKLDPWGSSGDKGDKIFRLLNASGEVDMVALPRHSTYLSVEKAKIFGQSLVYISTRLNYGKILRLNLADITQAPEDLSVRSGIEIYSFAYNPVNNRLMYDVYDSNTNTCYLIEQDLTTTTVAGSGETTGYKITDVVPFKLTE